MSKALGLPVQGLDGRSALFADLRDDAEDIGQKAGQSVIDLRQAVKQYLDAIVGVSRVGTPELSHYAALDNLFDAVGGELSPESAPLSTTVRPAPASLTSDSSPPTTLTRTAA